MARLTVPGIFRSLCLKHSVSKAQKGVFTGFEFEARKILFTNIAGYVSTALATEGRNRRVHTRSTNPFYSTIKSSAEVQISVPFFLRKLLVFPCLWHIDTCGNCVMLAIHELYHIMAYMV